MPYPEMEDVEKFRATFIPIRRFVFHGPILALKEKNISLTMATEDMKNEEMP